jgi:hypothetical protein
MALDRPDRSCFTAQSELKVQEQAIEHAMENQPVVTLTNHEDAWHPQRSELQF